MNLAPSSCVKMGNLALYWGARSSSSWGSSWTCGLLDIDSLTHLKSLYVIIKDERDYEYDGKMKRKEIDGRIYGESIGLGESIWRDKKKKKERNGKKTKKKNGICVGMGRENVWEEWIGV